MGVRSVPGRAACATSPRARKTSPIGHGTSVVGPSPVSRGTSAVVSDVEYSTFHDAQGNSYVVLRNTGDLSLLKKDRYPMRRIAATPKAHETSSIVRWTDKIAPE